METEQATAAKQGPTKGRYVVSPLNGAKMPKGRRKGSPNKVTATIREAIETACREVTDAQGRRGLAAWLLERANGGIADRQIFAAMVAKALPLQVTAQGASGVVVQLNWLQGRNLAPHVTATSHPDPNSLILKADTRDAIPIQPDVIDVETGEGATADPPPPLSSAGGGVE